MDWTKKFPYEQNFAEVYYDSRDHKLSREDTPRIFRRRYSKRTRDKLSRLSMIKRTNKRVAKGSLTDIRYGDKKPLPRGRIEDLIEEIAKNRDITEYPTDFSLYSGRSGSFNLYLTWPRHGGQTGHRFQIVDLAKNDETRIEESIKILKFLGTGPSLYVYGVGNLWSAYKTKSNLAVLKYHYGLYI